jgi:hypothetical protein
MPTSQPSEALIPVLDNMTSKRESTVLGVADPHGLLIGQQWTGQPHKSVELRAASGGDRSHSGKPSLMPLRTGSRCLRGARGRLELGQLDQDVIRSARHK